MGGGVYLALRRNGFLLEERTGVRLEVNHVVVRDPGRKRPTAFDPGLLHSDWRRAVEDPATDLVAELAGGVGTAREVVERALELGKPVVTANKALLSKHGRSLFELARRKGAGLFYEASVGGGIPVVKVLRESLVGNRIRGMHGILNGTCNYILTRMERDSLDFGQVLAEAQELGFAEADPSLDIDGLDALHKTGILASLAFGSWVPPGSIHREGIAGISPEDIAFAGRLGYRIKLLSSIRPEAGHFEDPGSRLQVSVCPALIPRDHPLAKIDGVDNALWLVGDVLGEALLSGPGAGRDATASAVIGDLADALRADARPADRFQRRSRVRPWEELYGEYYLRLEVVDRPGTMAGVAGVLARAGIGISSIIQPESRERGAASLILMIHDAPNRTIAEALDRIAELDVVRSRPRSIRVEHFGETEGERAPAGGRVP